MAPIATYQVVNVDNDRQIGVSATTTTVQATATGTSISGVPTSLTLQSSDGSLAAVNLGDSFQLQFVSATVQPTQATTGSTSTAAATDTLQGPAAGSTAGVPLVDPNTGTQVATS